MITQPAEQKVCNANKLTGDIPAAILDELWSQGYTLRSVS